MIRVSSPHPPSQAACLAIPHELWRLTDGMIRAGALSSPEMALDLFPPVETIRCCDVQHDVGTAVVLRCLDNGRDFPSATPPQALASAMLAFLSAMPDPLVAASAMAAVETELAAAHSSPALWGESFLSSLSPARHNTFLYIVSFLHEVAKAGRPMGLRPQSLASSICTALCYAETGLSGQEGSGGGNGESPVGSPLGQGSRVGVGTGAIKPSLYHYQTVFRDILVFFIVASR
ncbi:unnamed protein product [Choristocarpus tenellus]